MKICEIIECLDAKLVWGKEYLDMEISVACGADLMSDCLAFVEDQNILLLTGLNNPQVVRTAEMMDVKAIMFVRGKVPVEPVVELAKEKHIVVMYTENPMFSSCGKLYEKGIRGKGVST